MSDITAEARRRVRTTPWLWLLIALAITVVIAANAHLVYVATSSQPDCVQHARQGEGNAKRGVFGAAQSSCAPAAIHGPS